MLYILFLLKLQFVIIGHLSLESILIIDQGKVKFDRLLKKSWI